MKTDLHEHIQAPQGVTISVSAGNTVLVMGPRGEVKRAFFDPKITITGESEGASLRSVGRRKEKTRMYSYVAHIKNMITGVLNLHEYTLKICSGHFPINVAMGANQLSVKNFLGEKTPRIVAVPAGVTVKVEGDKINVSSPDIELAGRVASSFEQLTRITNRDLRIFQDGIYIIKKSGELT